MRVETVPDGLEHHGPLSPYEYAATQSRYWPACITQDEREAFMRRLRSQTCVACGGRGMHFCDDKLIDADQQSGWWAL